MTAVLQSEFFLGRCEYLHFGSSEMEDRISRLVIPQTIDDKIDSDAQIILFQCVTTD